MKTIKLTDKEIEVLSDALSDYISESSENLDETEKSLADRISKSIKLSDKILKKIGKRGIYTDDKDMGLDDSVCKYQ